MACKHSAGERRSKRTRNHFDVLPEEIVEEILWRLPPFKLFQVQTVCRSWREIVRSSAQFHIQWEERTMEHSDFHEFNNWCLKAGCDSISLYAHKKNGKLRVLDALDLQSVELPDDMIGPEHLSFYLKKDLAVVKVAAVSDTYEVEISVH
ncbi:hypothetical protein SUGI_0351380 [Cryptomeria japonica]|nr:hypothetical protein SUGI_0351380 [Cryptomeria japonica]